MLQSAVQLGALFNQGELAKTKMLTWAVSCMSKTRDKFAKVINSISELEKSIHVQKPAEESGAVVPGAVVPP